MGLAEVIASNLHAVYTREVQVFVEVVFKVVVFDDDAMMLDGFVPVDDDATTAEVPRMTAV